MSTQFQFSANRLSAAIKSGKRRTLKECIAQADENLRHLGQECVEHIAHHIQLLENEVACWPEAFDVAHLKAVYDISLRLIGVGAVANLPAIDHAARSLCDVVDGMITRGAGDREPVLVHVKSLRLLNVHGQPPEVCAAIVDGLGKVRNKYIAKAE